MTPPQKVYEKKRKAVGTQPGTQSEPPTKKAKAVTSTQPPTCPLTDQAQPNPPLEIGQPDLQSGDPNESVMQIVRQLNEGGEGNLEGSENAARGAGNDVETEGEEGDEPYDEFKFSSRRAQKNFEKYWRKRSVIVERGMNLTHFETEEFKLKQNFEIRGWTKWAQYSGVAVVPIVQEFYANMTNIKHEGKDCIVTKVRGVNFRIFPKDVRKFFGLKEEKEPEFPFSEEEALDRDSLARVLTGKANAQWGHKNKLAKNRLSPKFNSLFFLACSQLNPVMNTNEISYDRGLLLYAIDEGMKVELGKVIFDSISSLFRAKKGIMALPFAGFITKFVCKRKVISELGEQVAKPLGPITASSRERSASHKKGQVESSSEAFMEKLYAKWDELNVELGEIKNRQFFIEQDFRTKAEG